MNGRTNVTTAGGDDFQIPLDAVTALSAIPGNGIITITWEDPNDKYATPEGEIAQDPQQLISEFDYTILVRKIDASPTDFRDGEVVTISAVRDQYASEPYTDSTVAYNTTYYYGAWAINKHGIPSEGVFTGPVVPKYYDPILANNSWERIEEAGNNGLAPSLWNIGDAIDIIINNETITVVILDFNHSVLADGSGTAAITFGSKELMSRTYTPSLRAQWCGIRSPYYAIGNSLGSIIPTPLDIKTEYVYSSMNGTFTKTEIKTINAKAFPFSIAEIFNKAYLDLKAGTQYPYYATASNRIKRLANGTGNPAKWILTDYQDLGSNRNAYINFVNESGEDDGVGSVGSDLERYPLGICFGFCVGKITA